MSLVFRRTAIAAGPTMGLKGQAASMPAAASVPLYRRVACEEWRKEKLDAAVAGSNGFEVGARKVGCTAIAGEAAAAEPSESSSIGGGESSLSSSTSSSSTAGDGEEEVQSKWKAKALGSLESLEESLPIKRGLSNSFAGKSRSFASLTEAVALGSAGDLAKAENPFNKRRRILMACKASWQRRVSYAAINVSSLRALQEDQEHDDDDDDDDVRHAPRPRAQFPPSSMGGRYGKASRKLRSFSLTDLREEA